MLVIGNSNAQTFPITQRIPFANISGKKVLKIHYTEFKYVYIYHSASPFEIQAHLFHATVIIPWQLVFAYLWHYNFRHMPTLIANFQNGIQMPKDICLFIGPFFLIY